MSDISRNLAVDPLTDDELESIVSTALHTLLWSAGEATDYENDDEFLFMWDQKYDSDDATPELRARIKKELGEFVTTNAVDLTLYINHPALKAHVATFGGTTIDQIPHDWILSRTGAGTGFWDRGAGNIGARLDVACGYHEMNLFEGPDAVEPLNVKWAGKFHAEW